MDGETVGEIGPGLLVYLGAGKQDGDAQARWMADKLTTLRIFADGQGKMSLDVQQAGGSVLVVSQFTLYGDTRKGRRPSFDSAAPPEAAERLYERVCLAIRETDLTVATGRFRAMMDVHAVVDGPVTIMVDSDKKF